MIVSELIEELKTFNPDAEVSRPDSETIELSYISVDGGANWILQWCLLKREIMKIVDLKLWIDGLNLEEDESVEDIVGMIESNLEENGYVTTYGVKYEVTYDEVIVD